MAMKHLVSQCGCGTQGMPGRQESAYPVVSVQQEVNRFFDDVFRGWGIEGAPFRSVEDGLRAYTPSVDVAEDEKEIRISAELPGLEAKDVEVSLNGDVLTIRGEKKSETEDSRKYYYRVERSYGAFARSVALPADVDHERISASFKNGVLTITLPKTPQATQQARKIDVKSA